MVGGLKVRITESITFERRTWKKKYQIISESFIEM